MGYKFSLVLPTGAGFKSLHWPPNGVPKCLLTGFDLLLAFRFANPLAGNFRTRRLSLPHPPLAKSRPLWQKSVQHVLCSTDKFNYVHNNWRPLC